MLLVHLSSTTLSSSLHARVITSWICSRDRHRRSALLEKRSRGRWMHRSAVNGASSSICGMRRCSMRRRGYGRAWSIWWPCTKALTWNIAVAIRFQKRLNLRDPELRICLRCQSSISRARAGGYLFFRGGDVAISVRILRLPHSDEPRLEQRLE